MAKYKVLHGFIGTDGNVKNVGDTIELNENPKSSEGAWCAWLLEHGRIASAKDEPKPTPASTQK